MEEVFPEPVTRLPEADIPVEGLKAHLSQAASHQILFMEFSENAEIPVHSHEGQFGVVLEGRLDLTLNGIEHTFRKGDRYYIPEGVPHSAKVHAGYADITFFDQKDRYGPKG